MFCVTSVPVWLATRLAQEDAGAARSPTYKPDNIAPPANTGGTPLARAMVINITPMVLTTPKLVPSA